MRTEPLTGSAARRRFASQLARLRSPGFARSVATLLSASTLAGVIGLAATPLITRLYSPSEFGVLGIYTAIIGILIFGAGLRYEFAIPYSNDDSEAAGVLTIALICILATSVICLIAVMWAVPLIAPASSKSLSGSLTWLIPIGMAASAAYAAVSMWMVRRRNFQTLGVTKITQGMLQAASQIGLGLIGVGANGLIVGQILGASGGIGRIAREMTREARSLFRIPPERLRAIAREYRRFPLYSTPAALLDASAGAIPTLVVASKFGATAAGILTLVQRVVSTPIALLTVNLGQVVFADLAERRRVAPESVESTFRRRLRQIALIGVAVVAPLLVIVPFVIPVLFGRRWSEAGTFFLILAPMIYTGLVSSPFGYVTDVLRRQELHLLRDSARAFVMTVAAVIVLKSTLPLKPSLALISAAGVLNSVLYLSMSWHAIRSYTSSLAHASDDVTAANESLSTDALKI